MRSLNRYQGSCSSPEGATYDSPGQRPGEMRGARIRPRALPWAIIDRPFGAAFSVGFVVFALTIIFPAAAAEPEYDLLLRSGKIVDGTGNPWFRGDIAIRGDRIVAVGRVPAGTAKREIDAT